ncbi:MAG TPA: pantoate--beta-alanine ligase [Chthoniobacterales bacterium]
MKVAKTIAAVRTLVRRAARPVVLVPTMGALHHGHAALIRRARKLAGSDGFVVVSIFVNPTQFGPKEDFSKYPRTLASDKALCREAGADLIFHPEVATMYASDASVFIDECRLSDGLCGASRPGHFRGVCTVVAKLFLIVQPEIAVFGQKDWQQLAVIRRMVRDLDFPVKIVGHPTVREADGLATSSRNRYLTPEERLAAPGIYKALRTAAGAKTPAAVLRIATRAITAIPGARIDYIQLVDSETLQPVRNLKRPTTLATAVFLGRARLIDNIQVPAIIS